MKRFLVPVCALLAAAGISAQGIKIGVGAEVSYFPLIQEDQGIGDNSGTGLTGNLDFRNSAFSARGFVDFTYGLVSVGYRTSASDMRAKESLQGVDVLSFRDTWELNQIELRVLGKYPVSVGFFTLTPMIGAEYVMALSWRQGPMLPPATERKEFNDVSLLGGVGAEFKINPHVFVRPSFTFGYNLTTRRSQSYYDNFQAFYTGSSGIELDAAVSVGYWL